VSTIWKDPFVTLPTNGETYWVNRLGPRTTPVLLEWDFATGTFVSPVEPLWSLPLPSVIRYRLPTPPPPPPPPLIEILTSQVIAAVGPTDGTTITSLCDATGADFLLVHGSVIGSDSVFTISATYNGDAMTQGYFLSPGADEEFQFSFWIAAPDTGTHDVVVTIAGATIIQSIIGCTPMTGVKQTLPTGTAATSVAPNNSQTSSSLTLSSAVDELVFAMIRGQDTTLTNGSGQTTVWSVLDSAFDFYFRLTTKAGAASVDSTFTFGAQFWLMSGQPIKPAI